MNVARGILFSPDLAQKVHLGLKTVTRRLVKPQPIWKERAPEHMTCAGWSWKERNTAMDGWPDAADFAGALATACPYGETGDLLYVRETWGVIKEYDGLAPSKIKLSENHKISVGYKTDPIDRWAQTGCNGAAGKWRPSIHMPRWAARTWLKIKSVRVERVQEITAADCIAEGIEREPAGWNEEGRSGGRAAVTDWESWTEAFARRWNARYSGSWDRNEFVWVIEFEKTDQPSCAK